MFISMSGSPFRFRRPSETRYLSSQQNLRESAALPEETPAQPQSRFTKGEAVSPPFYNPSLFVHQKDSETFILGTIYIHTYVNDGINFEIYLGMAIVFLTT